MRKTQDHDYNIKMSIEKLTSNQKELSGSQVIQDIKKSAGVLVVSPSYLFDFKQGTLILNSSEKEPEICGGKLAACSQLLSEKIVVLSGSGEAGTHFVIAKGISDKQPTGELQTLDEALVAGNKLAEEAEMKWLENEASHIDAIFTNRSSISYDLSNKKAGVILTSQVKIKEDFTEQNLQIEDFYYKKNTKLEEIQSKFQQAVNKCVEIATNRLFKSILRKYTFCNILDQDGKPYQPNDLIRKMMIKHLLSEMTHFVLIAKRLQIPYLFHNYIRNETEDNAMNTLLRLSMEIFVPDHKQLMQWVPITLKEIKKTKNVLLQPPTIYIAEQKKLLPESIIASSPPKDEKIISRRDSSSPQQIDESPSSSPSTGPATPTEKSKDYQPPEEENSKLSLLFMMLSLVVSDIKSKVRKDLLMSYVIAHPQTTLMHVMHDFIQKNSTLSSDLETEEKVDSGLPQFSTGEQGLFLFLTSLTLSEAKSEERKNLLTIYIQAQPLTTMTLAVLQFIGSQTAPQSPSKKQSSTTRLAHNPHAITYKHLTTPTMTATTTTTTAATTPPSG